MHIVDSHEFVEMYRGDKDLHLGFELCKRYGWKYTMLVPDVASPADQAFFGTKKFPMEEARKYEWPDGFKIKTIPAKLIYARSKKAKTHGAFFFSFSWKSLGVIKRENPDIIFESIFTTLTPRSYLNYFISKTNTIPRVYIDSADTAEKDNIRRILTKIEKNIVNNSKAIITYSKRGEKRFITEYNTPTERIHVIPKPIDIHMFNPEVSASDFNKKWKVEDKFRVAYFGRLSNNKGATHLVDVAYNLKHERDIVFMFVGGNITTKDGETIISKGKKYGTNNVVFTGKIPHKEMAVAQASAHIAVYPDATNLPGFSTVLAESMAMGRPIIIGIKDYEDATPIKHMETGIIVEAGNVEKIKEWVIRLKDDENLRKKLGGNAWKFAKEYMSWDKQVEMYKKIFESAVNE